MLSIYKPYLIIFDHNAINNTEISNYINTLFGIVNLSLWVTLMILVIQYQQYAYIWNISIIGKFIIYVKVKFGLVVQLSNLRLHPFLATPIFDRGKILIFLCFHNIVMMGIYKNNDVFLVIIVQNCPISSKRLV